LDNLNSIPTDIQILGIGLAIAQELARRGASVLITYVSSKPRADKAVSEIQSVARKEAKIVAIQANSANSAEAAHLVVGEAQKTFGFIDIIVNNAADGSDINLAAVTTDNFDHLFHANVLFPLLLVRESRQFLRKKARIVNISSTSARRRKLQ
jgi:3-oxoacyl-[acyl-carrier protein] reductase